MSKKVLKASKAYNNLEFLNSSDARGIRMLAEFIQPTSVFRRQGIKDTIVFFGSARIKSRADASKRLREVRQKFHLRKNLNEAAKAELGSAFIDFKMSKYYEDAVELSRLLTIWSKKLYQMNRFVVCSGGGPGIMEAANKGASLAKGRSVGMNISLPFEQFPNQFVSPELNFEFHYFFMRKFWFVYLGKALVAFPGGFGTFDELMEVLTLRQTKKIKKKITVVLYGTEFWRSVFNFEELVRRRLVSREDLALFKFADSPAEAYEHLVRELRKHYPEETEESLSLH